MCDNTSHEYFTVYNDKINYDDGKFKCSRGSAEDGPCGKCIGFQSSLSDTGNSHHHRLFNQYVIDYNEVSSSKIGMHVMYE